MADINVIVLPDGTEYPVSDYYLPVAISNPTAGQVLKYDATNQVWYNGDDAEGSSVFYGTSAPTSQLGVDGNLYVKYTEGTGGASDTVDALYVKLDGSWCQISTGGGGGTSDYNDLTNKPQINSVELSGNKSLDDLGIQPSEISKTASGSIASFSDGGDDIPVSEYECEIVAQQASGTPTPASPLPITGFSQADISVCGFNIFDEEMEVGTLNNTTGATGTDANKMRSVNFIPVKPNTTYGAYNNTGVNLYIYSYGVDKSFIGFDNTGMVTGSTFTTDSNTHYIKFRTQNNPSYSNNISINYPSSDTQYHAYTGNLYTVAFGQTIYGGRLIYANGQWSIEATFGGVDDLGYLSWRKGSKTFFANITGAKLYEQNVIPNMLCEVYRPVSYNDIASEQYNEVCSIDSNNSVILIRDTNYATESDFATAVTGKKAIFELATPVIIPITSSTRIKTISGVNNIFSNTGDNSVKYFTENADEIAELVKAEIASTSADYHEYSTEEKIVGKWIDGKTLYEKTIKFNNKNVTGIENTSELLHGISNIDTAFVYEAYADFGGGENWSTAMNGILAGSTMCYFQWKIGSTAIYLVANNLSFSASTDRSYLFTIRYTKTSSNTRSLNLSKGVEEKPIEEKTEEIKTEEVK